MVGEVIKKLRTGKGWSLRELERRTGINYSVLSRIESGKRPVTDDEINIFCDLFDVSTDYLLGRVDFVKEGEEPYYALSEKDEKDIAKRLEKIMNDLESDASLAYHGEPMDEETRRLISIAIENSMRMAREIAKKKFTPKKYRNNNEE